MVDLLFYEIATFFGDVFRHLNIQFYLTGDYLNGEWVAQIVVVMLIMCVCTIPFLLALKLIDFVCGGYTK